MIPDKPEPLLGITGPKKRGIYKPKNRLDGFLRFAIGGKYKWRRYEIFEDYLMRGYGFSKQEAKEIIAKYQSNGVDNVYGTMLDELRNWKRKCNHERALKAAKAKAKKYRKWSQERRQRFNLKKLERGT